MNLRYWCLGVIILTVSSGVFFYIKNSTDYARSRELVVFREMGHKILLSSKDSTSRVLPVSRSFSNQFKLEFEKPFTIVPDTLVKIVKQVMTTNSVASDYVVNVFDTKNNQLVYGFAVSKSSDSIVPCLGRVFPEKQYTINIIPESKSVSLVSHNSFPLFAFLLVLSLSGTAYFGRRKSTPHLNLTGVPELQSMHIPIGRYSFNPERSLLHHGDNTIILTPKETKLLNILVADINTVIDRNRLLKEGWEDEGVITQRSLDMYISRLRKKFANDPQVKITNVHGKGYCLSTSVAG